MGNKISNYTNSVTKLPSDVDQLDISTVAGGLESKSMQYSVIKTGHDLIAFLIGVDTQTVAKTVLPFNTSNNKKLIPTMIIIKNTADAKGLDSIQFQVQVGGNVADIIPLTTTIGFSADNNFVLHINGVLPPDILTASDTIEFEVIVGSVGVTTQDIFLYGAHEDA